MFCEGKNARREKVGVDVTERHVEGTARAI